MHVVLIGGGRWGRIHATVLSRLLSNTDKVTWVTHFEQEAAHNALEKLPGPERFEIVPTFERALKHTPSAAIIATATHSHAAWADRAIRAGLHAYVEKPLAMSMAEASRLEEMAHTREVVLGVGVELLFASYLHYMKSLLSHRHIRSIHLAWTEAEVDVRHGEAKQLDLSTPRIHDVYPHAWSIIRVLLPNSEPQITAAQPLARGAVRLHGTANGTALEILIDRRAAGRQRLIKLNFEAGGSARLDFTREPGHLSIDDQTMPPDPTWQTAPSPLTAALSSFLAAPASSASWPLSVASVLDSVRGAAAADALLEQAEIEILAHQFAIARTLPISELPDTLILDHIVPELARRGVRIAAADQSKIVGLAVDRLSGAQIINQKPDDAIASGVRTSRFLGRVIQRIEERLTDPQSD